MPKIILTTVWKKYQYLLLGAAVIVPIAIAVSSFTRNLDALEREQIHNSQSVVEQISKSTMNYILEGQYDNLLDTMRLLTKASNVRYIALYVNGIIRTRSGEIPGMDRIEARAVKDTGSWSEKIGSTRYLITDVSLPYHKDLLEGPCVLRIVFDLEKIESRKEKMFGAIFIILLLLVFLLFALYLLYRMEIKKSQTINEITHDAKKVLSRITGRLDNSYYKIGKNLNLETLPRDIKLTWEESLALRRFIDNLSDHENLSRGNIELYLGQKDLVAMLGKLQHQFEVTLAKAGKAIVLKVSCDSLWITTDEYILERILVNIIDNAVKFSNVQTSIEISLEIKSDLLRILIRDQGPGIARAYWEKVFEPFKRLKSNKKGTGLGLSNARDLARLFGGEFGIQDSVLEVGTTFFIQLPATAIKEGEDA
jgi:signal transduction histidine kinase